MATFNPRPEYTAKEIVKGILAEVSFSLAFALGLTVLGFLALAIAR
jgi:hypothetical protein